MQAITARELKAALDSGAEIQIIDVRQPDEFAFACIEGSKLIPLRRDPKPNGRNCLGRRDGRDVPLRHA